MNFIINLKMILLNNIFILILIFFYKYCKCKNNFQNNNKIYKIFIKIK